MNEFLFEIISAVIPALCAVVTCLLVPCIKANIDSEKLSQYKEWTALAVKTAEMLWTETGHGEDKKSYVAAFLNDMFNSRKTVITEEQLNILIESAVRELNKNS